MIKPFSFLYQTLKGNPRLYDTLDTTHAGLLDLQNQIDNSHLSGASDLTINNRVVKTKSPGVLTLSSISDDGSIVLIPENIGIGTTTNPSNTLQSSGSISSTGSDSVSPNVPFIKLSFVTGGPYGEIIAYDGGSATFKSLHLRGGPIFINPDGSGYTRIGSYTNPSYPLDVSGDINTDTKYRIGAVPGVSTATLNFVTSISISTASNGIIGTPGAGQIAATVVTGVIFSTRTTQFTGGILTV